MMFTIGRIQLIRKFIAFITLRLSFRGSQWLGELLLMTPVVVGLAIAALGEKAPMRILHDIISIPILM